MRGKAVRYGEFASYSGITPAYAGKSSGTVRGTLRSRDHPRLCGEKIVSNGRSIDAPGSPPPMRGKAQFLNIHLQNYRITPAYAGKSFQSDRPKAAVRDHPRLCGEKYTVPNPQKPPEGSPPPMRGKGEIVKTMVGDTGITPAYAGKRQRNAVRNMV